MKPELSCYQSVNIIMVHSYWKYSTVVILCANIAVKYQLSVFNTRKGVRHEIF